MYCLRDSTKTGTVKVWIEKRYILVYSKFRTPTVSNQEVTAFEASFLRFGNLKAQKLMKKLKINVLETTSQKKNLGNNHFLYKNILFKRGDSRWTLAQQYSHKIGHTRSARKNDPWHPYFVCVHVRAAACDFEESTCAEWIWLNAHPTIWARISGPQTENLTWRIGMELGMLV